MVVLESLRPFVRGRAATLVVSLAALSTAPLHGQVWRPGNQILPDSYGNGFQGLWGSTLATGDFDGDGFDDLVAASPVRGTSGAPLLEDVGALAVYRGSAAGLDPTWWYRTLGTVEGDLLGWAVAAGDFDDDGRDELAYSVPGVDFGEVENAGMVVILQFEGGSWSQESSWWQGNGIPDTNEDTDQVGQALTVGNFNGDEYQDLAIGVPSEWVAEPSGYNDAGSIAVLYGSITGLVSAGSQYLSENLGIPNFPTASAHLGATLAAGFFDDDDFEDLAVGAPDKTVSGTVGAGAVRIFYGGAAGLSTTGTLHLTDNLVGGALGENDHFGAALAASDFDFSLLCILGGCYGDLAVGIPGEPEFGTGDVQSGGVVVVRGSASGLDTSDYYFFDQTGTGDSGSSPEPNDRFGSTLAVGDLDDRIGPDLVVGVPNEDSNRGMIHLMFGGESGLPSYPGQFRTQSGFLAGPPVNGDRFGGAIAAGRFGGAFHGDLAVGVSGRDHGSVLDSGLVQVAYGALFADGFESGNTLGWTLDVP